MKKNLILIRGYNGYSSIEQIFNDPIQASAKLVSLRNAGYKEEYISLPWETFEEMQNTLNETVKDLYDTVKRQSEKHN